MPLCLTQFKSRLTSSSRCLEAPIPPSLLLKPVGAFWSARISRSYRVLAVKRGSEFYWFWIGPHDEYERIVND